MKDLEFLKSEKKELLKSLKSVHHIKDEQISIASQAEKVPDIVITRAKDATSTSVVNTIQLPDLIELNNKKDLEEMSSKAPEFSQHWKTKCCNQSESFQRYNKQNEALKPESNKVTPKFPKPVYPNRISKAQNFKHRRDQPLVLGYPSKLHNGGLKNKEEPGLDMRPSQGDLSALRNYSKRYNFEAREEKDDNQYISQLAMEHQRD